MFVLSHTDLRTRVAALKAIAVGKMKPKDFEQCEA